MKIKYLGSIVFFVLMIGLLGVGVALAAQLKQPLGPAMSLPAAQPASAAAPQAAATPTPETAKKFCGNQGQMTILVVGSDANPQLPPPGADLVRYVQIDFDLQKVTTFTFPRQLWLTTKHLSDLKIDAATLGNVYDIRYKDMKTKGNEKDPKKLTVAASQEVAQAVLDNFDLRPDHYVVVELAALPKLVDAVGGVTVNNPSKLVTNYDKSYTFEVGEQVLDGSKTASYVRFMDATHTDWDRIARQNLVLQALYKKIEDPAILSKIPNIFTTLVDSFVTDLSVENITDLTCVLTSVADDQNIQDKVRPEMVTAGPQGSQLPDIEKIKTLLRSLGMIKANR